MRDALLVFFKAPEAGKVKTRLLTALSPEDAARLYACFVEDTFEKVLALPVQVFGFVSGRIDEGSELFRRLARKGARLEAQVGNDLGERMSNAFRCCFEQGFRRVVIIGTDSPDLPLSLLEASFDHLGAEKTAAAIAGALDGGYVLLGMNRYIPEAFQNVPYSSSETYAKTLAQLRASGATVAELEKWYDIDEPEDLDRLAQTPFPNLVPKTLNCLNQLKLQR